MNLRSTLYTLLAAPLLVSACKKEQKEEAPVYYCTTQCTLRYPGYAFPADEYSIEDIDTVQLLNYDVSDTTFMVRTIGDTIHWHDSQGKLYYTYRAGARWSGGIFIPATNQEYGYNTLSLPNTERSYICGQPKSCTVGVRDIVVTGGSYSISEDIDNAYFIILRK